MTFTSFDAEKKSHNLQVNGQSHSGIAHFYKHKTIAKKMQFKSGDERVLLLEK